jgi:dipeptide/tripeptide permease
VLALGALVSSTVVRAVGTRYTVTAGLLAVTAGVFQIAAVSSVTLTYIQVLPGMLLMGLGAGLLMPAATDSVLGTLPQADAGVGSATNSTAIQLGGALGVAVVGSVLSSRFQRTLEPALAAHHVGGSLGSGLAHLARLGYSDGSASALIVAGCVTGAGAVLALVALPSRPDPPIRSALVEIGPASRSMVTIGPIATVPVDATLRA